MVKVKVLNGFTDSKIKDKNYQDGEVTEISEDRFKELEGIYVEKYEDPIVEKDNSELQEVIDKLEKEKQELEEKNKELQEVIDKLEKEKNSKADNTKKSKEKTENEKSGEEVVDGEIQKQEN